jgi:hypothetical protein
MGMRKEFKKQISIRERNILRKRLLKPFIKKYKKPVLVHSTPKDKTFFKILDEGKLKFSDKTAYYKENSFVEKMFNIDKGVFFSLGFVYSTAYSFKYSFIFDLGLMQDLIYYENSIAYQCYKSVIDYWDKNDVVYLEKLSKKNKICVEVVHKYYNEKYKGKTKSLFDFWKCEKEVLGLIKKYPKKKELIKIIKRVEREKFAKYPNSIKIAMRDYNADKVPEIISKKSVSLNDKNFLGFYIEGTIPKKIIRVLKEKYPDKILFDGKKIESILNL